MHIGHYISGVAHVGLIGWALFGGQFTSEPRDMEIANVAVLTTEEFERVLAAQRPPSFDSDITLPQAPDISDAQTPAPSQTDDAPVFVPPRPDAPDTTESLPDLSDITAPQPAEVTEELAVLVPPSPDASQTPDMATDTAAAPMPAPRVAPQPVAAPPPDTSISDVTRDATEPDESAEVLTEEQDASAPEAASTRIVTEATETSESLAPSTSTRPVLRPPPREDTPTDTTESAVNDALAAAIAGATTAADEPRAASGPPLTSSEREGLRVSVGSCWNVNVGSPSDSVIVVIKVLLTRDGLIDGPVELISTEGGDESAKRAAYDAARRAVIRCQRQGGRNGYDLPAEKYDHWREIEMTFNPEKMRRR